MELIFTLAGMSAGIFAVLWLVRVFMLGPYVAHQLDTIEKPAGRLQYLKRFVFYLKNPDRLQKKQNKQINAELKRRGLE